MSNRKSSTRKDQFRRSVYSAARSLGWFIPQTEEEVAASEDAIETSDFENTGDPVAALDREPGFSKRPTYHRNVPSHYADELRRAARLGNGLVSEEIEERMRRHREQAEREKDGS